MLAIGIQISLVGGARAAPDLTAGYALYLDFKNQVYGSGGARKASLSAMPGYAFTDNVDNVPNIDANGYKSLTTEVSDLEIGATLPSGDFIAWVVMKTSGAPAATVDPFGFSTAGSGTTATRILPSIVTSGSLAWTITVGGVAQTAPPSITGVITSTAGRPVVLLRSSGGVYSAFVRRSTGVVVSSTAGSAGSIPTAVTAVEIGAAYNAGAQLNDYVEFFGQRNGTFDDAACTAIVTNA